MAYPFTSTPKRTGFMNGHGSDVSTVTRSHTYTSTTTTVFHGDVGTSTRNTKWSWSTSSDGQPYLNGYSSGSNSFSSKTSGYASSMNGTSRMSEVPKLELPSFDRRSLRDFYPSRSSRSTSSMSRSDLYRKYNLISSAMIVSNEVGSGKSRDPIGF